MTSKRSLNINLAKMRKGFAPKPLAVGIAAVFLSACGGSRQEATVYTSPDDCKSDNPEFTEQCETAYQQALIEAERTGPKYNTERDCESEFGNNQCRTVQTQSGSFFMPFMAGYMLSNIMSPRGYYTQPMYTSYSRNSALRYRWLTSDGNDYGDIRKRKFNVSKDAFKPKPTVTKTMSRGGFGSSVRAKSSWGSSKKSGWGG
jgi:uncharacterized protein YgiB involved in biofilm formation